MRTKDEIAKQIKELTQRKVKVEQQIAALTEASFAISGAAEILRWALDDSETSDNGLPMPKPEPEKEPEPENGLPLPTAEPNKVEA